jgi:protein SCO1/2
MASSAASTASPSMGANALCQKALHGSLCRFSSVLVAAVVLASGCQKPASPSSGLPFYNTADFTAVWLDPSGPGAEKIHRIAAFSLTNQLGQTVTDQSLRGRIYVANFFFARCQSICPKMATHFRKIQAATRDDDAVVLLSHSVDPERDTLQSLQEYAAQNKVMPGKWHLLTGDREAMYRLARQSYFAEKSLGLTKTSDEFLHTENMFLIDRHGRIRGIYNATLEVEADRILEDIRLLHTES